MVLAWRDEIVTKLVAPQPARDDDGAMRMMTRRTRWLEESLIPRDDLHERRLATIRLKVATGPAMIRDRGEPRSTRAGDVRPVHE